MFHGRLDRGAAPGSRRAPAGLYILLKLRLATEDVVIVLGEAMGLIADVLKELQADVVARKVDWFALGLRVNQLFLLGQ